MEMATSQNGWSVLWSEKSKFLHYWIIPASSGDVQLLIRRGPSGFLLAHQCLWLAEGIEPVAGKGDDHGWNPRHISGSMEWSNHASGTAMDLNSAHHPSGTHTYSPIAVDTIHSRMHLYEGVIRWGGDYRTSIDEMHWEIDKDYETTHVVAHKLRNTSRGQRLLDANPRQAQYI
jgi:hypothetical protein